MTCFGLAETACSRLVTAVRGTEVALNLFSRFGVTGSILVIGLALLQWFGAPLLAALRSYLGLPVADSATASRAMEAFTDML